MNPVQKITVAVCLLFAACAGVYAQTEVHLSIGYLPNHQYALKSTQITNIDMKFSGNKKAVKQINAALMNSPTKKTATMRNESVASTGNLYNDSLFPLKLVMTRNESQDGPSTVIPAGTTIYGTGSTKGTTTFDSIAAEGMDPKVKTRLFALVKNLLGQISVPEHTFKVGEKYTHQTPLTIPISGVTINMMVTTTYKLKSVTDGIAYLDITQEMTMNGEMSAVGKFKAGGAGKGSMSYDIKNRYFTKYELNATLNMEMSMEGVVMKMKMESASVNDQVITAN